MRRGAARAALAMAAAMVAAPVPAQAIVHGLRTPIADAPWVVAIIRDGAQTCTGTVIAPDVVLTAAHCVTRDGAHGRGTPVEVRDLGVVAGRSSISVTHPPHGVAVESIDVHARYRFSASFGGRTSSATTAVFDVALVRLAAPVAVPPLALADHDPPANAAVRASGFGRDLTGIARVPSTGIPPRALRSAAFQTITRARCGRAYPGVIEAHELCAGDRDGGPISETCFGDSGGPLVLRSAGGPQLVGVLSWGSEARDKLCGETRLPQVYMSVAALRAWLDEHLAGSSGRAAKTYTEPLHHASAVGGRGLAAAATLLHRFAAAVRAVAFWHR